MRVVLLEDVSGLGMIGDVKEVADGYARNFLIPRKLAEFASPSALKRVEEQHRATARRRDAAGAHLVSLAEALDGVEVVVKAKVGEQGRLYGSVTNSDVAEAIHQATGHEVDRKKVELEEAIHQPGEYEVVVRLSKDLLPRVKVVVEGENGQ